MTKPDYDKLMARVATRASKVIDVAIGSKVGPRWLRFLVHLIALAKRGSIVDNIGAQILADLVRRDQMQGWTLPTAWKLSTGGVPLDNDVRKVIAEMIDPAFDLRSEAGISNATGIDLATVRAIVALLVAQAGAPFEVWRASQRNRNNEPLFTLRSRRPSLLGRLPIIRDIGDWLSEPVTDEPDL